MVIKTLDTLNQLLKIPRRIKTLTIILTHKCNLSCAYCLNYHRPCGFATKKIDGKGKEKKVYALYRTPFEALLAHPRASEFLKEGFSIQKLQEGRLKSNLTKLNFVRLFVRLRTN